MIQFVLRQSSSFAFEALSSFERALQLAFSFGFGDHRFSESFEVVLNLKRIGIANKMRLFWDLLR